MEEKHVNLVQLSIVFEYVLITNICESFAKFQEELLNLLHKSCFKLCFQDRVFYTKESQIVTASKVNHR